MTVTAKPVTKSIRLSTKESESLRLVSEQEHTSEAALMKQFVLDGLARWRINRAAAAYARRETDLSGAARYAGVSVQQMMAELDARSIEWRPTTEQFIAGLETMIRDFGGSPELRRAVAELRAGYEAASPAAPKEAVEQP